MTVKKGPSRKASKVKEPEVIRLSLFGRPEEAQEPRQKRAVVPKDVGPRAERKMPYYGERHPKYAYARGETPVPPGGQQIPPQYGTPEPAQPPAQVPAQPSSGAGTGLVITGIIIFIVIIYVPLTMDDGGGGLGSCQTSCGPGDYEVTVAPQCSCPAGSRYYNTISNPPSMAGYKQCICG